MYFGSKIDTDMSSTNQTGMNKGHKGFHMHNMTYRKRLYPLQGITGWKSISIKSGKNAPKSGISRILVVFKFHSMKA